MKKEIDRNNWWRFFNFSLECPLLFVISYIQARQSFSLILNKIIDIFCIVIIYSPLVYEHFRFLILSNACHLKMMVSEEEDTLRLMLSDIHQDKVFRLDLQNIFEFVVQNQKIMWQCIVL